MLREVSGLLRLGKALRLLYRTRSLGLPWAPEEEETARVRLRVQSVKIVHMQPTHDAYHPTGSSHRQDPLHSRVGFGAGCFR